MSFVYFFRRKLDLTRGLMSYESINGAFYVMNIAKTGTVKRIMTQILLKMLRFGTYKIIS